MNAKKPVSPKITKVCQQNKEMLQEYPIFNTQNIAGDDHLFPMATKVATSLTQGSWHLHLDTKPQRP